jgi:indole-3-glycerol phosphate synthase
MLESLAPYYDAAQQEAQAREAFLSLDGLKQMISAMPEQHPQFAETLATSAGVSVIAEHKRASPSEGEIDAQSNVARTVEQYRDGGALALSILTQKAHFDGSMDDLTEARQAVQLPILRKDFISSTYQLHDARAFGADAVLLIVGGLKDEELSRLHEEANSIGLDCLVEVHDKRELERALAIEPTLVGINNRNLTTMEGDLNVTRELITKVPKCITTVAESRYSVTEPEHMRELRVLGVNAVLMGKALMKHPDPAGALRRWIATP